ncbi:MAG TPA: Asp-tRNA(Asn)/Glu-tRNA(Gln) amidotransferase subunit GatC [Patescibacteria group bacterium]|nr:Asp-tRNA(Asn)/Glu-tRNA(Gln) amidotransferase subunit GatC [Patescibacteria group bacterium]
MKLDKKQIKHIAELARLDLTEQELNQYGDQLSEVLSYIDQLKEVDTGEAEPTAQVTDMENILRRDEKEDWDKAEVNEALEQAPELEGREIKVKRVLE